MASITLDMGHGGSGPGAVGEILELGFISNPEDAEISRSRQDDFPLAGLPHG